MRIKGFDINRAQENIDFDKIEKSGAKFVILRAGIRTDTDTYFQYYLDECIKRKLPYGLFWYFEATSDEAFDKELAACVKIVKELKPEYPVFFRHGGTASDRQSHNQRKNRYGAEILQENDRNRAAFGCIRKPLMDAELLRQRTFD